MPGALIYSPADVIRQLLIDLGHGSAPSSLGSWPIFVSQEPSEPDAVITIYDTAGIYQGRVHTSGEVQERHGFQVRVRAANYVDAYTKAQEIAISMDEDVYQETVTVGAIAYTVHSISRTSGPIALGKEVPETKRDLFTINATVSLRQN